MRPLNMVLAVVVFLIAAVFLAGEGIGTGKKQVEVGTIQLPETNYTPPRSTKPPTFGTVDLHYRPDGPLYYMLKENLSTYADAWGTHLFKVRTNSKGLRDEHFSREKPADVTRILVLGDSFVFGFGVNESQRFTEILEQHLNRNLDSNFQLINAGVNGWGMKDYYLFLRHRGINYAPDLIVVTIVNNDQMSREKHDQLAEEAVQQIRDKYSIQNTSTDRWYTLLRNYSRRNIREYRENTAPSNTGLTYLNNIKQLTDSHNTETIYYAVGLLERDVETYLQKWAEQNNATLIRGLENIDRSSLKYRISLWDYHPNPQGHWLLAKQLYDVLAPRLASTQNASLTEEIKKRLKSLSHLE